MAEVLTERTAVLALAAALVLGLPVVLVLGLAVVLALPVVLVLAPAVALVLVSVQLQESVPVLLPELPVQLQVQLLQLLALLLP